MAKDWRTLKLELLAETKQFVTDMKKSETQVETFGDKATKMGKVAAAAFAAAAAAAAAYAGKLAIEGVKAAIEDEAAQKRLALALENVTNATDAQIKAVEEQILKTSLATGVADDKLRPALQRLAVATGSVERSQELLSLALDISAATGKDVETVTNALAKAYEGNNTTLTRLGVGITAAEAKTLGFEGTVKQLSDTFGGAAATQANTFEGQIKRLQVAFDEAKESVGAALLPTIQQLLNFFVNTVIPKFKEFKSAALDPVTSAIERNRESLTTLGTIIKDFVIPIILNGFGDALRFIGKLAGGIIDVIGSVVSGIQSAVTTAINAINTIIRAYNAIPILPNIPTINAPTFSSKSSTGSSSTPSLPSTPKITTPSVPVSPTPAASSSSKGVTTTTVTPVTPTVPNAVTNFNAGSFRLGEARTMQEYQVSVNVYAPSAIDREGFSRAVVSALNESTNRGTTGAGDFRTSAQIL